MFFSWFVARSRQSSWAVKRPTLWRCLRRCSPASWGKRRRRWRSFSSVTTPSKVRRLECEIYFAKRFLLRIGQLCFYGIPWFSVKHLQADVSGSNSPRLGRWSARGIVTSVSSSYISGTLLMRSFLMQVNPYTTAPVLPDVMKPPNMETEEAPDNSRPGSSSSSRPGSALNWFLPSP